MNPYEPPQTIEEPLPMATEVHPFVRTREGLIRAAALCVEGGRIQFAAGLVGILAVLLALQRAELNDDGHFEKLLLLISIVVTVVLWTWGAIKNYRGYTNMADFVTNEQLARQYNWNTIQWWIQLFLVVLYLLTFPRPGFHLDHLRDGILVLLILSYLASVVAQARTLRYWYSRFELHAMAQGYYLAGGLSVVICLGLELLLPYLGWRNNVALHVMLALLLAVTAWDYSQRYHTVHEALVEERDP
jgi:hypothetical protein